MKLTIEDKLKIYKLKNGGIDIKISANNFV